MPVTITGRGYPSDGEITVKYMTVGEMIDALSVHDHDMPVGVIGHFGELHAIQRYDIRPVWLTRIEHYWKGAETQAFRALTIEPPDIGPEPD